MFRRTVAIVSLLLSSTVLAAAGSARVAVAAAPASSDAPLVLASVQNDLSAPLPALAWGPGKSGEHRQKPHRPVPSQRSDGAKVPDPGISPPATASAPALLGSFDGVGNGFAGPQGTFIVASAPPDPNGAVGPNHYVQVVNSSFAVFNKIGAPLYGPVPTNTLWSGFGGGCQTNNDGDATVIWDGIADRWVFSTFSVATSPYLMCVAVSSTPDPLGTYYRYSFGAIGGNFPDYPKLGVWPDGYYLTVNMFNSAGTFAGTGIAALDRLRMLAGLPATQLAFQTAAIYGGVLPASVDGQRMPPAGAPNYLVALGTTSTTLIRWKLHADWTTPASSTLVGPSIITVPGYAKACSGGGTCIPQAGTTQLLDSLADRVMYRLAYRNLGDHESLVVNHSVTVGQATGVRWYELRISAGEPILFQQGTYAPDTSSRWLGSVAIDGSGGIGLGFSISSATAHPGIHYTGRLAGDPLGQMTQGEGTLADGAGSQTGQSLSRWGDYSALTVDPTDDCTFWYTNEYNPADGAFNWKTRIGSFKLPGCGAVAPAANDFSLSATPSAITVVQGASGTSAIASLLTSGVAEMITLASSGLPTGGSATSSPASVSTGSSSTLTIATGATTPPGTYTVTVSGTATSATHATPIALTVTAAAPQTGLVNGGFESAFTGWARAGATATSATANSGAASAMVGSGSPFSGDSSVAQTFTAPSAGGTLSFFYRVVCKDKVTYDWATATLRDNASGTVTTVLAKTCTNTGSWSSASASLVASHSYTLTLVDHDDNYANDPTYTLYDDVTIGAPPPPPASGISNGTFENGTLSGWTATGPASGVSTTAHAGTYGAKLGSATATNGDSALAQTFAAPAGATRLSLWYASSCPDTVTYDWVTVTLRDNTAGTTATVVGKTCAAAFAWTNATANVVAGHAYTLTLTSHDDNYASDPTYSVFDDVALQ